MITVKGRYLVSKDGGKNWLKADNKLLFGYYMQVMPGGMQLEVGAGTLPPTYNDSSLTTLAKSNTPSNFDGSSSVLIESDKFSITKQRTFNFGTGHSFSISEVGLLSGSVLVSRALFKDYKGNSTSILITPMDSLQIKYSMTYTIPRTPFHAQIEYLGQTIGATITLVNPERWGGDMLGEPVSLSRVSAGANMVIGNDGRLTAGIVIGEAGTLTTDRFADGYTRAISGSVNTNASEMIGTFSQMIITDSSSISYASAIALIELDTPITKTDKTTLTMGLTLYQRGENGNT